MKKSILLLAIIATTGMTSFAQEGKTASYFESDRLKPTQGDVSTEFGLTGGILNSEFTLNEGTSGLLKFRYFLNDHLALRLGANIGVHNETQKFYGLNSGEEGHLKSSNTAVLINLGIEKHFDGTRRLSPYVGGDILFGINAKSDKADNSDGFNYIKNMTVTQTGPGTFGMGVRGIVGADYYIAKHVFIGVEAGLGLMYYKAGETKTTTNFDNTTHVDIVKSTGSDFNLGANMVTGVRIGFVF